MNKYIWAVLGIICTLAPSTGFTSKLEGDILIQGVNIVSTRTLTIKPYMDVLISGQRIVKIGHQLEANVTHIVDGRNRYLSPGLIDSHTHLDGIPGMNYPQMQNNSELVKEALAQIPRSYLYYGFTTVIDLHSDAGKIKQWNAQTVRPQAHFCGGAPIVDGYPMSFIPKPIRYQITPYFLIEGDREYDNIDPSLHTPKAVVNRMKERGAVCVKTHYETGFSGKADLPVPSAELIQQLVSEAHDQGLNVVLHANSQAAQNFGVRTGVDAFVHGMWNWNHKQQNKLGNEIRTSIEDAIENRVSLQPTFQVLYGERDLHNPDYLKQSELHKVLPKTLIDWYASEDGQSFRTKMSSLPHVQAQLSKHGWQAIDAAAIRRLELYFSEWLNQGGELLFGSDTPSDLTFANPPGLNGRQEMVRWQQAGVTATQFLKAATINSATFFNLNDDIGSINEGKRADLLLLSENPLKDIRAFDHIEKIFIKGQVIERESLAASLNN